MQLLFSYAILAVFLCKNVIICVYLIFLNTKPSLMRFIFSTGCISFMDDFCIYIFNSEIAFVTVRLDVEYVL